MVDRLDLTVSCGVILSDVEPATTVLCSDLDQEGLHALLDLVRALGLELVDIRQVPDVASTWHPPGAPVAGGGSQPPGTSAQSS